MKKDRAMPIKIRAVAEGDRAEWEKLYQGYAEFYRTEQSADMRARVWEWLFDPGHEVEGLVAEDADGRLVGLAHYRAFARPLAAATGGFLDDLFVDPAARGSGGNASCMIWRSIAVMRGSPGDSVRASSSSRDASA